MFTPKATSRTTFPWGNEISDMVIIYDVGFSISFSARQKCIENGIATWVNTQGLGKQTTEGTRTTTLMIMVGNKYLTTIVGPESKIWRGEISQGYLSFYLRTNGQAHFACRERVEVSGGRCGAVLVVNKAERERAVPKRMFTPISGHLLFNVLSLLFHILPIGWKQDPVPLDHKPSISIWNSLGPCSKL